MTYLLLDMQHEQRDLKRRMLHRNNVSRVFGFVVIRYVVRRQIYSVDGHSGLCLGFVRVSLFVAFVRWCLE